MSSLNKGEHMYNLKICKKNITVTDAKLSVHYFLNIPTFHQMNMIYQFSFLNKKYFLFMFACKR